MTTIPPNPEEALVTISTPKSDTVRVRDRVESSRFEFYFDGDVEIEEASTDDLYFPVDVAVRLSSSWSKMTVPMAIGVFVHDHHSGNVVHQVGRETPEIDLEAGSYELELSPAPVKIYILVQSAAKVRLIDEKIQILTGSDEPVYIGVRSPHEHPAGTITTTADLEDLMVAVSHLGSALKTTSAERSWPTLRGQPPTIKLGDELDIPSTVSRYDVDVRIEIPCDRRALFNVTPLAYYTSARLTTISTGKTSPALIAAGERVPLTGNLGTAAGQQLKRNVLLDSVVRSVGIYPFVTAERTTIEDELPWALEEVYSLPLGERVAAYQDVPESVIEDIWRTWPLTIDVSGTLDDIPALPHLAEELAIVRIPDANTGTADPQPGFVTDFIRADGSGTSEAPRATNKNDEMQDISRPLPWDTQLHSSLEDGYPLGSNKTSIRAYERHLDREAPNADAIEVKVVCNDDEMREEDIVTEFYGLRDLLEFDISSHYNLTTTEFLDLLSGSYDLIHYIGHVDEAGFKCQNGYVDAVTEVDEVDFDVFLLNACRSVEQGEALLDAGADGGIATLYDIPNSSATKLGRTLSRLLNRGFTIRSALEIAREVSFLANRWVSLGDGRVSLTQSESGVTMLSTVTPCSDGFQFELESFETSSHRIGTIIDVNTDWAKPCVLPGKIRCKLSDEQLEEYFALEVTPVKCGNELYWTDEVSPGELREQQ